MSVVRFFAGSMAATVGGVCLWVSPAHFEWAVGWFMMVAGAASAVWLGLEAAIDYLRSGEPQPKDTK